ncbi:Tyr recombinase domain-containing protein [Hyphomicrobiales bacterium]|nr:Tyr recombinase domain-containing protein [Hyphomicrobiales bacterium]CAH1697147.1 conserved hypothetical protein [Hyphomicrobiales bacterium]CAI0342715.1 Tyr recombinase domain-containing protein [Hyphomicrobiales bacterium]
MPAESVAELLPEIPTPSLRAAKSKFKLSDALIGSFALPDGRQEVLIWDSAMNGLALRVGKTRRSWSYVYRPAGSGARANPQKISLGAWPAVTVARARQLAQIQAGQIAAGKDPAAERREEKRRETATIGKLLDGYEANLLRRRYANRGVVMKTLRRGLAGLDKRDAISLSRRDLVERIDAAAISRLVVAEDPVARTPAARVVGGPGASADLRKHLRTFFEWTTNSGATPFNPLAGLRRERATRAERIDRTERGRALSDAELLRVWSAADPTAAFGRYVRALILTGARRREMSRLHWSMVQEDRLVLPPSHTKQGRPHEIPIVRPLKRILAQCPRVTSGLVFASARSGGEFGGWTQYVEKLQKTSGVRFTLHDLRRTMRSGLTELGVDDTTAEMMLAHQRDELERIYDKNERWPARRRAARLWAAHIYLVSRRAR